jgi:predicted lipoprotein with Yx(FWY)xxD motif
MCSVRAASDHEWDMLGRTSLPLLGALPLAVLALAGCGGNASHALPTTNDGRSASFGVASTGLGDVLVDRQGRTLYLFARDAGTTSACTGACAANWPPLRANGKPKLGSGANASLVGTIMRSDGKPQVTYNGHPLYLFKGDKQAGDMNGEGLTAFGGTWYVLSSSGNQVVAQSPSSGGGGYGY